MLNKNRYVRMLTGLTALLLGLCGCAVPPETTSAPSGVQAPVAPANVPEKPDAAADAGGAPVTLNLADFGANRSVDRDDFRAAVTRGYKRGGFAEIKRVYGRRQRTVHESGNVEFLFKKFARDRTERVAENPI